MKKVIVYFAILITASVSIMYMLYQTNLYYDNSYDRTTVISIPKIDIASDYSPEGFQSDVAVAPISGEVNSDELSNCTYGVILVNNDTDEVLVSHNAYRRIYPASTTKLITAMVVCDAIDSGLIGLDDMVTVPDDIDLGDPEAMASEIYGGCTISVRNLLYGLLIKSYNDYAVILADYVSGDVTSFAGLMNSKAERLMATGCHFVNPHGLHEDDHYVTAYDMYLIMREASKYDIIGEIDACTSFTYSYYSPEGVEISDSITPTNLFLSGQYSLPSNISIKQWKTGTTNMAGYAMTMNVVIDEQSYTLFIADSESSADLYEKISLLFNMTN